MDAHLIQHLFTCNENLSKEILQETINDFGLNSDMSNIALNFEEKNQIRLRPLTE